MLILLPPSETKRAGGDGPPLDLDALTLPGLGAPRRQTVDALVALSADADTAARVLKLSPRQHGEIEVNARLRTSPTMAAVDRYTGVLFDALDAATLGEAARRWLGRHVSIHSAPFGPVAALDAIPAYRLSAAAALPGLPPAKRLWAAAVTEALALAQPTAVLDLRSEAYAALGPVPPGVDAAYVRVVTEGEHGQARALNHFNKHAKGHLVRMLATDRPRIGSIQGFRRWARSVGLRVEPGRPGELDLFV